MDFLRWIAQQCWWVVPLGATHTALNGYSPVVFLGASGLVLAGCACWYWLRVAYCRITGHKGGDVGRSLTRLR